MAQQIPTHPVALILEEGIIRSLGDFLRLNIIDWSRYTVYWQSEQHCMDRLGGWFVNQFSYKVVELDLHQYPKRDDFPGWEHVGNHVEIGKLYWNHFKYCFDGVLRFHDSPDFSGVIYHHDRKPHEWSFWGDIGKVSPIAMLTTVQSLVPYTIWISVINYHKQVILEPLIPVEMALRESKSSIVKPKSRRKVKEDNSIGQLSLFDS